jgi:hypothetical protein
MTIHEPIGAAVLDRAARAKLVNCLGPQQAKSFVMYFEALAAVARPGNAPGVARAAKKGARLLRQALDIFEAAEVADTVRRAAGVDLEQWRLWHATTARLVNGTRPTRGRPPQSDRDAIGALIAATFRLLNMPTSRAWTGAFARTCAIVFGALGYSVPAPEHWKANVLHFYEKAGRLYVGSLRGLPEVRRIFETPVKAGGKHLLLFEHLLEVRERPKRAPFQRR